MTHRGPFQPLLFCDSVIPALGSCCLGGEEEEEEVCLCVNRASG